ncbi:MAG: hypothetical protein V4621_07965 [Pseudomonadota bacterium]
MLDEFAYHEAVDRLFVIQDMANGCLVDHPAIQAEPEVLEKVQHALSTLADAYQLMARKEEEKFPVAA